MNKKNERFHPKLSAIFEGNENNTYFEEHRVLYELACSLELQKYWFSTPFALNDTKDRFEDILASYPAKQYPGLEKELQDYAVFEYDQDGKKGTGIGRMGFYAPKTPSPAIQAQQQTTIACPKPRKGTPVFLFPVSRDVPSTELEKICSF